MKTKITITIQTGPGTTIHTGVTLEWLTRVLRDHAVSGFSQIELREDGTVFEQSATVTRVLHTPKSAIKRVKAR